MSLLDELTELSRPVIKVTPPVRRETTENRAEFLAIAHLRGWCHDTLACPTCSTERRAWDAGNALGRRQAIREIAEGR